MPRKGHSPEQVLNKLQQVEVALPRVRPSPLAVKQIEATEQVLSDLSAHLVIWPT